MFMYTLFIDTHSSNICLALYDGKILIKSEKESIESHSIYVVPMLKELMENNNVSFDDIKNVVAVNGPGSFTGIRIGLSVAKAICYSLDKPIYLISSLTSMLVSYESDDYKMAVIPDNKGFYISVFDKDNNSVVDERYQENIDEYLSKYNKVSGLLDVKKIIDYVLMGEAVNVFKVKANYVKVIEVMNDKKQAN